MKKQGKEILDAIKELESDLNDLEQSYSNILSDTEIIRDKVYEAFKKEETLEKERIRIFFGEKEEFDYLEILEKDITRMKEITEINPRKAHFQNKKSLKILDWVAQEKLEIFTYLLYQIDRMRRGLYGKVEIGVSRVVGDFSKLEGGD